MFEVHPSGLWQPEIYDTVRARISKINADETIRTLCVPVLGGLTIPAEIALQMSSAGTSVSVQETVKRGESHRTMEEGSS